MCWLEIKTDIEDIIYKRVGIEDAGIYKISKLTMNLLELTDLFKEERDSDLANYIDNVKNSFQGEREDVFRERARDSVRRYHEIKLLKKKWDGFWREVFAYV